MKNQVDVLNSTTLHASKDLTKCLAETASGADNCCRVYCLYHNPHDERYALQEALAAQKSNKFVTFDSKAAASLLSNHACRKVSPESNKSQKALFGGGICGSLLFSGLLPVVLSTLDSTWKIVLACVFAVLLVACAAVSLFVGLARRRRNAAQVITAEVLKKLDAKTLERRDFCYSAAKNRIFVVTEPTYGADDNFLWQFFLRFAECKPPKAAFGVLLLKTVRIVVGEKHASELLAEPYEQAKKFWKKLDFGIVEGGYLVPLTDLEKIQLVEELGLGKKIPNGFLSYGGRDYFYGFEDDDGMSLEDYGAMVDDVYARIKEELGLQSLSKDGVRQALSFLATLQLFLGTSRVDNVSDVLDLPENKGVDEYFCQILQSPTPLDTKTCKRILQIIWADPDKLPRVVKREYALLTAQSQHSDNLPITSYQKAVLCAIGFLKYKNENFFVYEDMETDVNAFLDKILYWYGVHSTLRIKKVSDNWLGVISYLLSVNASCGYFARNCYLLRTVDDLYKESRTVSDNVAFERFYLSDEVQKAYELNALVCPHCTAEGEAVNTQKMHLAYLENVAALKDAKVNRVQMPQYFSFACSLGFELLPAAESEANLQRYYDLLMALKQTRLLDVFRAIYERSLEICAHRLVLRRFSEHYNGAELTSAIKNALAPVNADSHVSDILCGDNDSTRVLACGFVNCDLLYLAYDMEQSVGKLVFDNEIDNPCYRFAARLSFVEKNDETFSNVFNEMVDDVVLRTHNKFAEKYFLDRLNHNMFGGARNKILAYLWESKLDIDYAKVERLSVQDTDQLIRILYGVSDKMPNSNLLDGMKNVPCVAEAEKMWQYFCGIVLNKQSVAEKDKEQFVEDLAEMPANVVYVLFTAACKLDNTLCAAIPKVANKLLRSIYINKCTFILDNINCVAESERKDILFAVKVCIINEIELNTLPDQIIILAKYANFMRDDSDKAQKLEMAIMQLYAKIAAMEQESLRRNAGYLLHYAYNMINTVGVVARLPRLSQFDKELSVGELVARRRELKLLAIKDGVPGLGDEMIRLISATLGKEATLAEEDLADFYKQTLDSLIELFEFDYVQRKIPNVGSQTALLKQMRKQMVFSK